MERTYYRADLEDISPGSVIMQQFAGRGDWRQYVVSTGDYELAPTGQNNISTIIMNIQRFSSNELPYYKVAHIHPEDIKTFSFYLSEDPTITKNTEDVLEFKNGAFTIVFHEQSRLVELFEEIKRKDGVEIVPLFTGTPLNLYELKMMLQMTGVAFTQKRNLKAKSTYK